MNAIEDKRVAVLAERDAAQSAVAAMLVSRGRALINGGAAADDQHGELAAAQERLARLNADLEAVEAAQAEQSRADQEAAEKRAEAELRKRLKAAEDDLEGIREAGGEIDAALEALKDALANMDARASQYVASHDSLGLHESARNWMLLRGWTRPVAAWLLYKSPQALRNKLRDGYTDWSSAKGVSGSVPDFTAIMTGRKKKRNEAADVTA